MNLARLYESAGRRERALAVYDEILRFKPESETAKKERSRLLAGVGAGPSAAQDLEAEAARNPTDPVLQNNLGSFYAEKGEFPRALEHYQAAVRLDPGYALPHKNLAALYEGPCKDAKLAAYHRSMYELLSREGGGSGAPAAPAAPAPGGGGRGGGGGAPRPTAPQPPVPGPGGLPPRPPR